MFIHEESSPSAPKSLPIEDFTEKESHRAPGAERHPPKVEHGQIDLQSHDEKDECLDQKVERPNKRQPDEVGFAFEVKIRTVFMRDRHGEPVDHRTLGLQREKKQSADAEILRKGLQPEILRLDGDQKIHSAEEDREHCSQQEKRRKSPPKDQMRERLKKRYGHGKTDGRLRPDFVKHHEKDNWSREVLKRKTKRIAEIEALHAVIDIRERRRVSMRHKKWTQ